jgi:DNA-binding XRE family transcriptional regulator
MTNSETENLYKSLGQNIKNARLRKDYNQEVFAKMLKLSRASIVNIEKGRQKPTLHLLYEICKITESSLTDILPQFKSDVELTSVWKIKMQKSISKDSKSERNLSNFLLEVTKKNKHDDNQKS